MAVMGSHHTRSLLHGVFDRHAPAAKPQHPALLRAIPREVILMVGSAFGILIAVGSGALIAAQVPDHSPWLFMLAFAGPASVVFVIFWLISRRL